MKTVNLIIESPSLTLNNITKCHIEQIVKYSNDKFEAAKNVQNYLNNCDDMPIYFKCGAAGSHIWISDKNNERKGIIYI